MDQIDTNLNGVGGVFGEVSLKGLVVNGNRDRANLEGLRQSIDRIGTKLGNISLDGTTELADALYLSSRANLREGLGGRITNNRWLQGDGAGFHP